MDTRNKIVSAAEARSRLAAWRADGQPVEVVTGLFDPLLAAHAELLESTLPPSVRVLVQVEESGDPVMQLADRCELVAALRRVDLVCATWVEPASHDFRLAHEEIRTRFRSLVVASAARPE